PDAGRYVFGGGSEAGGDLHDADVVLRLAHADDRSHRFTQFVIVIELGLDRRLRIHTITGQPVITTKRRWFTGSPDFLVHLYRCGGLVCRWYAAFSFSFS